MEMFKKIAAKDGFYKDAAIVHSLGTKKAPSFKVLGIGGPTILDDVMTSKSPGQIVDALARLEIEGLPWDQDYVEWG